MAEERELCGWREISVAGERELCGWREISVSGERSLWPERELFLACPFPPASPFKDSWRKILDEAVSTLPK